MQSVVRMTCHGHLQRDITATKFNGAKPTWSVSCIGEECAHVGLCIIYTIIIYMYLYFIISVLSCYITQYTVCLSVHVSSYSCLVECCQHYAGRESDKHIRFMLDNIYDFTRKRSLDSVICTRYVYIHKYHNLKKINNKNEPWPQEIVFKQKQQSSAYLTRLVASPIVYVVV